VSLGPAEILVLAVVVLVFIGPGDSRKRLDTADQRGRTRAVTSPT
jgi:Sec-independent protein translocase protein TatA